MFSFFVLIFFTTTLVVAEDDFCLKNHNAIYADASDCHYFYQCFNVNETYAFGIRRKCAVGLFWSDKVQQCMPEGPSGCVADRCLDDATSAKGCYAGTGCRQYYACANTASYGMCCPIETRFVEANCSCVEDQTCTDMCAQTGPLIPTTVAPPQKVNDTVCRDSFGVLISNDAEQTNAFHLVDDSGQPTVKLFCPQTTIFSLVTCRCDIENEAATLPPQTQKRLASFWASFDDDTSDHSINKFMTVLNDGAQRDTSTFAQGKGSLRVNNNGFLSIPGLTTFDLQNAASFCAFFKCDGDACSKTGGILSNFKDDAEYTAVLGIDSKNSFTGRLHFWQPVGLQAVKSTFRAPSNGWNHVCVTYSGNAIRLYLNGAIADMQFLGGFLSFARVPYVIGYDKTLGYFNGYIDDVLITPFAMTQDEVEAHRKGDRAYLNGQGFGLESDKPILPTSLPARRAKSRTDGQKEFFIVQDNKWNWAEAPIACTRNIGKFATINSWDEYRAANKAIKDAGYEGSPAMFWVSLSAGEARWEWQDGTEVKVVPGENELTQNDTDNCCYVDVSDRTKYTTQNAQCEHGKLVLCEFQNPKQYRFVFNDVSFSWNEGKKQCLEKMMGSLATIASETELRQLVQVAAKQSKISDFWIGCRKYYNWLWVDGNQKVPLSNNMKKTWMPNEPSGDGNCGALVSGLGFNDAPCAKELPVLCES